MLWALGVAAVISGDFSGWNFGLDVGGFGGLLIATLVITMMYIGLCYSIAEMSPAMPHTGGAYSFARSAMGPWGGYITGLAENIEYVVTPAVVVWFAGAYAQPVFLELFNVDIAQRWWWLIFYVIFVGLNILGIEATMRFSVVDLHHLAGRPRSVLCLAIPEFDASRLTNIVADAGQTSFLPFGTAGIFAALPFAIWFYLAIEELPLAAEESMDPKRDVPRGTMWGLWTLVIAAMGVLFLNTGVTGAEEIRTARRASARRVPGGPGKRHQCRNPGSVRPDRLDRKLPHHHLRLRAEHLLAVAGRLLPALDVGHPRKAEDAVRGTLARRDRRLDRWPGCSTASPPAPAGAALLSMAVFGAVISYSCRCLLHHAPSEACPTSRGHIGARSGCSAPVSAASLR